MHAISTAGLPAAERFGFWREDSSKTWVTYQFLLQLAQHMDEYSPSDAFPHANSENSTQTCLNPKVLCTPA